MSRQLRVSVRGLVEHSLRSGDLDLESFSRTSLLEGIRGHQKLQGSRPEGYRKEVAVSRTFACGELLLEVQGRIDGVWEGPSGVLIEEIKTTRGDPEELCARERPTHWGQLQVYAFLYAEERGLETLDARLTYYQLDTGKTAEVVRRFGIDELRGLVEKLVSRYVDWMARVAAWIARRDSAIAKATFPFPSYRPGQREMAVAVYRVIREGGDLLVQAPTGIGKTAAALFPSLKALSEGKTERIFYLTARTTGRALAEDCLRDMGRHGAELRWITLTAKEKICFNPEKACNGEECEFARGFYARIDAALAELESVTEISRSAVETLARKHRVCPFELSLELAPWCDVVIGDYNYVFDPRACLQRFFDEEGGETTLLVDEAHNLLDRSREMFSAEISKSSFAALRRALDRERDRDLVRAARAVTASLAKEELGPLLAALRSFLLEAESFFKSRPETPRALRRQIIEVYFDASWFTRTAERLDDSYAICREPRGSDLRLKLFCRDPAARLKERFSRVKASILFSATLAPLGYFRRTLGLRSDAREIALPSPFPGENLRVLIAPGIATIYRKRASSAAALTRLLADFVASRSGNYLLYFPSYEYLGAVHHRFAEEFPEIETAVQSPEMSEAERTAFLGRFEPRGKTLVGFAVMGGFFGEAIDLPGEKLEGVAVVGVGLPALSPERDRIREHFEREDVPGFDYAYVYPGMNRVLQAAGRVIRSEADRGAVLLVDERFAERRYRSLLPPEWRPRVLRSSSELRAELETFWSNPP